MPTLHQIACAPDGTAYDLVGPVSVHRQFNPKTSKNDKLFSSVILKSAGNEMFLTLWDAAAKWKLPPGELTLRGKFVKNTFNGAASLKCEELAMPEGSTEWTEADVQAAEGKPKMKDCLDAGLRCADYMVTRKRPELAGEAFTFGANALIQGVKLE